MHLSPAASANPAEVQNASMAYEGPDLINLYQAYQQNPSSVSGLAAQFPLLQLQGATVAIAVKSKGDFGTLSSSLNKLGMQVITSSATYAEVDGYLPIAQLPAVAALPEAQSVSPIYKPISGPPLLPPTPVVPPGIIIFPGESPIEAPTPPVVLPPPSLPPLPPIPTLPTPTLPKLPPAPTTIPPPPAQPLPLPPPISYVPTALQAPASVTLPAPAPVAASALVKKAAAARDRKLTHKDSASSAGPFLNIASAPFAQRAWHGQIVHLRPRFEHSPGAGSASNRQTTEANRSDFAGSRSDPHRSVHLVHGRRQQELN